MKGFKKLLSCILILSILIGHFPPAAFAWDEPTADAAGVDTTITGENDIGTILADEIEESSQALATSNNGSAVLDITITDSTASVEYSLQEDAALIVGIYTEDGKQLITSSKVAVTADSTFATVTFPEALPQYFYISAYIADSETNAPLCPAYRNPMYTADMQQLLNSTVEDYDSELVLNLDESSDTNFLVFTPYSVPIPASRDTNIVRSADDETGTYIIDNADSHFTDLTAGQIIRYPYGDNQMLIVKVSSVSVSGTTVTITGEKPEIKEIFQVVKLESDDSDVRYSANQDYCDDGITYAGSPATRSSGSETIQKSFPYEFDKDFFESGALSCGIEGTVTVTIDTTVNYYLTWDHQYIHFAGDLGIDADLTISSKVAWNPKLFDLRATFFGVVSVGISGKIKLEAAISAEINAEYTQKIGFIYDDGDCTNLNAQPQFTADSCINASVTFGVEVGIYLDILWGFAKATLSVGVDFTINALFDFDGPDDTGGRRHFCEKCIDVDIDLDFNVTLKLQLIWFLKKDFKLVDLSKRLGDMYYSFDLQQGGFGECPNQDPQLVIKTVSAKGSPLWEATVEVTAGDKTYHPIMLFGIASLYVPAGQITITATHADGREGFVSLYVSKSQIVEVVLDYQGMIGSDIHWRLSADGDLTISGSGSSQLPCYEAGTAPWEKYGIAVKQLYLYDCAVAPNAFIGQTQLAYVFLKDVALGSSAFKNCIGIRGLDMASNIQIGDNAFESCTGLTGLNTYGVSFWSIGSRAFADCTGLKRLSLSTSTTVGSEAFANCTALTELYISGTVSFDSNSFSGCTGLTGVYARSAYNWLQNSFADETANPLYYAGKLYLNNALATSVSFVDQKNIPAYAFAGCTSLTELTDLKKVTSIGTGAFYGCTGLTELCVYEALTEIGANAFAGCTSLCDIYFYGDPPTIAATAFTGVTANAYHLDYLDTWLDTHRQNYGGTLTWDTFLKIIGSGTLSSTVSWRLLENGSLTVFGTGVIPNYYEETPPWSSRADMIASVTIEEGITTVGYNAFVDFPLLTSVSIPSTVTAMHDPSFKNCPKLEQIHIASIAAWSKITFAYSSSNPLQNANAQLYLDGQALTDIVIPGSVGAVGRYTFAYGHFRSVTIEEDVTTIGEYAFRSAQIDNLSLPVSLISIEQSAFEGSQLPNTIVFPEQLQTIAGYTFRDANTSKVVFTGNTQLGAEAFSSVHIAEVQLGPVSSIGTSAFRNTGISTIDISGQNVTIGAFAFDGCDNLVEVTCSGTIASIKNNVFKSNVATGSYATLQTIMINGNGSCTIADDAFYNCRNLSSISINGVASIKSGAFSCWGDSITADVYIQSLPEWCNMDFGSSGSRPTTYNLYLNDELLTCMELPEGIVQIKPYAFSNCTSITKVVFPTTLTQIGSYAFLRCSNLQELLFTDSLTHINGYAFEYCYNLQKVTLPASLIWLGHYAFAYSDSINEITFLGDVPSIGIGTTPFQNVTATVYYSGDSSWTNTVKQSLGGTLTWVADSVTATSLEPVAASAMKVYGDTVRMTADSPDALRIENYTGLNPEQEYLFVVVVSENAPELLADSNLIYIDQGTADEYGMISFSYNPRYGFTEGYPMLFGGGKLNLTAAQITFPTVYQANDPQLVAPIVELDGVTLTEGTDYTLSGDLIYSIAGSYSCTVTGIGSYCGSVDCVYAVNNKTLTLVTPTGSNAAFAGLTAALNDCQADSFVRLEQALTEDLIVEHDAILDLNGFDLTGDVTIADGATLYVFDTATAGYTSDTRGKLMGTVTGALSRTALTPADSYGSSYRYLTLLEQDDTYSFHRIYLGIHTAVLTPYKDYGDYIGTSVNYKAAFKGSDMVMQHVTAYGAEFSLEKSVELDFLEGRELLSGNENMNERKTTIRGTLRSTNTKTQNAANALMAPQVHVYIRLNDGLQKQIDAPVVELSLKQVVERSAQEANTIAQKTALAEMYNLHKGLMDTWGESIGTIKLYSTMFGSCATNKWQNPLSHCTIISPFGYRYHPITGTLIFHYGVDLSAPQGMPIYATRAGRVTTATFDSSLGYYVQINHGDGFTTRYLHMTHYIVSAGQYVEAGQVIGYVGSTGVSTAPHLDFSIWYNGTAVNPVGYIDFS